jgi:drug/metabolite transporter (DMT)-like permease
MVAQSFRRPVMTNPMKATALAVPASLPAVSDGLSPAIKGALCGLAAAAIWGLLQASARLAATEGVTPFDLAALRFATAGLILLPWVLKRGIGDMAGTGWRKAAVLAMFIGPIFFMTNMGGYLFAPLAHGTVILPAIFTVIGILFARLFFGEVIGLSKAIGVGIVILGLLTISGPSFFHIEGRALIGDAMFATAAVMWASATVLVKRWRISPMQTTASVAVLSAAIYLPAYAAFGTPQHLSQLPLTTVAYHAAVSGVLAGIFAVLSFTRSVELLGPGRAAIYPALVPAFGILMGIPLTDEMPTLLQLGGLILVSLGLLTAIGAFGQRSV